jgi:hypothetical protein
MKRLAAVLVVVLVATGTLRAQQPAAFSPLGLIGSNAAAKVSVYSLLLTSLNNPSSLLSGQVPPAYQVLGLTDEQTQKITSVCAQAKAENDGARKARPTPKPGEQGAASYRTFFAELRAKQQELNLKYAAQLRGLLTDDQKALLDKIEAAAKVKADSDQKARDVMVKAQQESLTAFEGTMDKTLSADQKAKLGAALQAAPAHQSIRTGR